MTTIDLGIEVEKDDTKQLWQAKTKLNSAKPAVDGAMLIADGTSEIIAIRRLFEMIVANIENQTITNISDLNSGS